MKQTAEQINHENQGFIDHIAELRTRLIRSMYSILLVTILCYNFSDKIFNIIRKPIEPFLQGGGLIFTSPLEKFMAHIQVSISAGVILSCPLWLYQVWKFISPGLYEKEKKYSIGFIFSGAFLFLSGISFAYFVVYPAAFEFLMNFGGTQDRPMISIDQYLGFMTITTLLFGLSFELPLVIVVLGMLGLVSQKFLREKRRYAIVALSVVAAVLSPPDIMSMVFMMIPLFFLYEIGVFAVGFFERKAEKARQEQEASAE